MTSQGSRQSRLGVAALCALVALGTAAFVPPIVATADAFETPKTIAWCLALPLVVAVGAGRLLLPPRRDVGGWAAAVLLVWMAARSLAARPVLDPLVLVGWMLPPALFLAGRRLSGATARAVARTCLWVGGAQAALMLLQRAGVDPLFGATTSGMAYAPGRMVGTVGYHNQAVDLLAVCGALGWWLGVFPTVAILGGIAALASYRAGLAGTLAGIALLGRARPGRDGESHRGGWVVAVTLVCLLCLCLAVPQTRARLGEAVRRPLATPALRTRMTMARAAWAMVRERPLAGWGSGAYAFQYMRRLGDIVPAEASHRDLQGVVYAREPHNDVLHLWCEFGVIGLLLCGAWIVAVAARVPRAGRFLLGYWAVASCFGFPWHDAAAGPLAGLALGLMSAGAGPRVNPTADGPAPSAIGKMGLAGLFGIGIAGAALGVLQAGADAGAWHACAWQGRALAREGGLLALEGRHAEAKALLERSRRTERSPEQCNNLGFVLMKLGKPSEAEAVYAEWTASGMDQARALRSLAGALEAQGKWLDAGVVLLRLYRHWPRECGDGDLFRTAALLVRGGDVDSAWHLTNKYRKRYGHTSRWTAEWENLLAAEELRRGNKETARRHFLRALEMKPELESARRNLRALGDGRPEQ